MEEDMRQLSDGTPREVGVRSEGLTAAGNQLQRAIEKGVIGAATLTVARRGKIIFSQGYGQMHPEEGAPSTEAESVFLLASITKPVTAWALMMLVDSGEVSLDDPVNCYLPEFRGGARDQVKVRHLLSHTSGMPDMLPNNTELRRAHEPLDEFVRCALQTPLLFAPNSDFRYQSKGTLLAAEIVQRVSGQALRVFKKEHIFDPLGMRHSSLGLGGRSIDELVWCGLDSASDEDDDMRSWGWNTLYWRDLGAPWGGMHSNGRDLAILLQTALNGGVYGQERVLSSAASATMVQDHNTHLSAPWGLGWALAHSIVWNRCGELASPSTFGHTGATGTVAWADPQRELICVVLTNKMDDSLLRRVSNAVVAAVE